MTQPQLLQMALNPKDVVYTPRDVARDVVDFFKPSGKILEPCCGDGAFLEYLPEGTEWCEVNLGRDFFANHEHYDWIVGNPPYSNTTAWLDHAFELADNVLFVMPARHPFNSLNRLRLIQTYGGLRTILVLGNEREFPLWGNGGTPIAAHHFQRGYKGGTYTVFRDAAKG